MEVVFDHSDPNYGDGTNYGAYGDSSFELGVKNNIFDSVNDQVVGPFDDSEGDFSDINFGSGKKNTGTMATLDVLFIILGLTTLFI